MKDQLDGPTVLGSIRLLVIAVSSTDEPVYRIASDAASQVPMEPTWLAHYFRDASSWELHFMRGLGSCDYLDAFWIACCDIVIDFSPVGVVAYDEDLDRYCSTEETFNMLAQRIRAVLAQSNVSVPAKGLSTLLCQLELETPVMGAILSASIGDLAPSSRASMACLIDS